MMGSNEMQIPYDRYCIDLAIDQEKQDRYYTWLSPDECDRAQRFKYSQHQRDFVASRGHCDCTKLNISIAIPKRFVSITAVMANLNSPVIQTYISI